ncbi:hypothetical protein QFC19_000747 [Naganishia cerealis]|uniref:Uncharacterized protein n=1 Tax=Naganishia cerealis TaxID=610337 RepID=A0ACC2WL15_9TREE|nr:hypothetical protein QFC19_000747 [Naganishia cerealis]
MAEFTINADTRIQILDELSHLARARKHQYAAFVRDEGVLCVWADAVENVVAATESLEQALIDYIWHQEQQTRKQGFAAHLDVHAQQEKEALNRAIQQGEKEADASEKTEVDSTMDAEDLATLQAKQRWKERPVMLYDAVTAGLTVIIILALLSLGWRTLIKEYLLDGKATRFVLIVTAPLLACVAAFAVQCLVGSIWQILGPIRQVTQNSAYYSAIAPKRTMGELPHVTVWLPVYKESLEEVIMPTIESLKAAQSVYERQGGSVSILVCDDGLQLISPEDVEARRNFYYDNNMAFVARPGHGVDGFERRGRFKKASNMNFAIQLSLRVEEIMDDLRPEAHARKGGLGYFWHEQDELDLYETALALAQEELEGRAWAAGNIRIGSYILIIDSDTRVPEDCFADAVSEFALSPEVAVIQHSSGVMQEIMFEEDGVRKIWSESHVSEDFALSLALQLKGYVLRWATYSDDQFEEGVSLTCDDEVNRWQKYAWVSDGSSKKSTLRSDAVPIAVPTDKFYLSGWKVTFVCICLFAGLGNLASIVLRYRLKVKNTGDFATKQIMFMRKPYTIITLVQQTLFLTLVFAAFFSIFFTGLSWQISTSLICHMIGYQMTWAATLKTVEVSNFFKEVPAIFRKFRFSLPVNVIVVVSHLS